MAIRTILVADGNNELSKKSSVIEKIDDRILTLLDDLYDTMKSAENGIGLAAPQIGVLRRAVVVKLSLDDELFELINPEILETKNFVTKIEGCLSLPGKYGYVERPEWLKLKYQDRTGDWQQIEAEGFLARAFCHEIDHLNGVLFSSKVTEWCDT